METNAINALDVNISACKHPFNNPELYNLIAIPQYLFAQKIIEGIDIKPTDKILDIGCGDGRITFDIANRVPFGKMIGTDLSDKMVTFAKKTYLSSGRNNLEFMVMDAERNVFSNQFDTVISFFCLQWVRDQVAVLEGIKNALIPGGKMVLTLPLVGDIEKVVGQVASAQKWSHYFSDFENPRIDFTQEAYAKLLEEVGFEKQVVKEEVLSHEFSSKQDVELFLKACIPHMNKLAESEKDEFLSDITTLASQAQLSEDKLVASTKMLVVSAVKPS